MLFHNPFIIDFSICPRNSTLFAFIFRLIQTIHSTFLHQNTNIHFLSSWTNTHTLCILYSGPMKRTENQRHIPFLRRTLIRRQFKQIIVTS